MGEYIADLRSTTDAVLQAARATRGSNGDGVHVDNGHGRQWRRAADGNRISSLGETVGIHHLNGIAARTEVLEHIAVLRSTADQAVLEVG